VAGALLTVRLPSLLASFLAGRLQSFFHRPVTVGQVDFSLEPFEVRIDDLRVHGPAPGTSPFLEVPRVAVVPSLGTLFSSHVVLARVRLDRPRIRIHAYPGGGDDIPKMGGGPKGRVEVELRRLVIADGSFELNHERVPMTLDLPDFKGRLSRARRGVLAGHVSFGPGRLRFGANPELPLGTELDVTLEGSDLAFDNAHLRARGTDLAYSGWLKLGKPVTGGFRLDGPVDLDLLEQHVMRTGLGIKGDGRYAGELTVEGSRLRLKGRLFGTQGEYDQVSVPRFDGQISWDERGVLLTGLELEALQGRGRVDLHVPPRPAELRLHATLDGLDAEALVQAVFDIGRPGLGAGATGELTLEWPRGQIRQLSGRMAVDLSARNDGRTPLAGRFEWRAQRGLQTIEQADLRTPSTHVRLSGQVRVDDSTDIDVDGDTLDLAAADDIFRRLRLALGNAEAQSAGFGGQGRFRGRWTGSLRAPIFEGRAEGQRVQYLGVTWGDAQWVGGLDGEELRSHSLVLRRPDGELWLDGRLRLGEYGGDDGLALDARWHGWPAADFIRAWDWRLDAAGLTSGTAHIEGRRSAPLGRARVTAAQGTYYGVPFTELTAETRLRGDRVDLSEARARLGGGHLRLSGSVTAEGLYDGSVTFEGVDVANVLPALPGGVRWGGRVSGAATLAGPLDRPRLQGQLRSARVFVGDEGLGAIEARLSASGDGRVHIAGTCRSPRVGLALTGEVGAAEPYVAALTLRARDTSVDPFLRVLYPQLPSLVGLIVGGDLQLAGPLLEPVRLRASAELPQVELRLPEYPVRNRQPLRFELEEGRLSLARVQLAGEGTDLAVEGQAALVTNGPLALEARGDADLRALSFVSARLRGRGAAHLALRVTGQRDAPQLEGRLDLDGAGLRVRGLPHGLEDLHGALTFNERGASFRDVRGTLGGGSLGLAGQISVAAGRLRSFDIQGSGRGMVLRYPEGLRSQLDADLRLFGDAQTQWATGSIDVRQALWSKRYELASELLATSAPRLAPGTGTPSAGPGEGLRYDVRLRVPGTLRIDNNLAALQARAELRLQGSYLNPVVLGRAEIERGRVYFQGNTYVIRRGTLDFTDPRRIDPRFDIEAESRVRSYRVTLKVAGTLERVAPTLTSDPPLSAVQILNLLAGADEATVASLTLSQTDQARLAAAGAATLAAGRLSEQVGLERGAERLLGLNRFSIDPAVVKGGVTNPTARITVGKRLTPDLNVQYSTDLRGTEERILSIEYTLSDRLSLLLTRNDPGGYGFDLRLRQLR
jgi:hypothetical protein